MKVLVTGGTGRIGGAVVKVLVEWGANVGVLCRSDTAVAAVEESGAQPVEGNIDTPGHWLGQLARFDSVIHTAATFDDRMGQVDARLVTALLERFHQERRRRKLLYTGGAWVFGNTDGPADETAAFNPPPEWQWMADSARRVMRDTGIHGLVVHPAIVVDDDTGVPATLVREAERAGEVRLPCPESATWPLVDRGDLAPLYALALDAGPAGESYIGASLPAAPVARLAAIVARRLGIPGDPVVTPVEQWTDRYGAWASGYALSQHLVSDKAQANLGWRPRFVLQE